MGRPAPRFHDFIGQRPLVDRLKRLLDGAQTRKEPFPHSLFRGLSGLGKTALTRALAAESSSKLIDARGQFSRHELAKKLAEVRVYDFFFVDEAHLLKNPAVDMLFEAIDKHKIIVPNSKRSEDKEPPQQIDIPAFTLVIATDQPGALPNALIKRFSINEPLIPYPISELREIADVVAKKLNVLISPQCATLIAEVSNGLPRTVEHYLAKLRLWFPDSEKQQLSSKQVADFLSAFGVDDQGLRQEHHQYLNYLKEVDAASLESLAIFLGTDEAFVRHQIEHPLMSRRFIIIGKRGRRLSHAGRELLETLSPSQSNHEEDTNGND